MRQILNGLLSFLQVPNIQVNKRMVCVNRRKHTSPSFFFFFLFPFSPISLRSGTHRAEIELLTVYLARQFKRSPYPIP